MMPAPRTIGPHKLRLLQGSPEWQAARRDYITATDIPAIAGLSPYKVEADLAAEKLDGTQPDSNIAMRVGTALEDVILDAYAAQTGRKARHVRGLWQSRLVPWAAASPDATAAGRLVELKWTGSRRRFADGLPPDVEAQCQWQALVAEVNEVDVATLTVGDDDVRVFTVTRDDGYIRQLVALAADFRRRLAEGGPFAQSLESIKRTYPADDGSEMAADPDTADAVRALWELRGRRRDMERLEAELETRIKERMATATALVGDGFRVTWKRTKDREEVDYRRLAEHLMEPLPEPERAALVGPFVTVREGFRPFRVTMKGDPE